MENVTQVFRRHSQIPGSRRTLLIRAVCYLSPIHRRIIPPKSPKSLILFISTPHKKGALFPLLSLYVQCKCAYTYEDMFDILGCAHFVLSFKAESEFGFMYRSMMSGGSRRTVFSISVFTIECISINGNHFLIVFQISHFIYRITD